MQNFRTDLALERRDLYKKANNIEDEVDGIETEEEKVDEDIKITRVKVLNENGENAIGKKVGNYITIDINNLKIAGEEQIQKASEALTKELKELLKKHIEEQEPLLVVGLGNLYVTPDALGPKVVQDIDVTRHILQYMPEALDKNTRPVSAISPGVLGTTGIETLEILKVMLADDHVLMREGIRQLLEFDGTISVIAEANKGRSMEGALVKITRVMAVLFMVLAVVLNINKF